MSGLHIPAFSLLWKSRWFSSQSTSVPPQWAVLIIAPTTATNCWQFPSDAALMRHRSALPAHDSDFQSAFSFFCCPCRGLIFSWQSGTVCAIFQWLLLHMRKVDSKKMLSDCIAALSAKQRWFRRYFSYVGEIYMYKHLSSIHSGNRKVCIFKCFCDLSMCSKKLKFLWLKNFSQPGFIVKYTLNTRSPRQE